MSVIEEAFRPIYGLPCWSVTSGLGSFLRLNFCGPLLMIREPQTPKETVSVKVRSHLARREVTVRGSWYLWIGFCGWRFYNYDQEIGSSISSKRKIKKVVLEIDGQALNEVSVENDGVTIFKFDLGGWLETYPTVLPDEIAEEMDCWTLFEPSGMALTLRKDRSYCHKPSRAWVKPEDWQPLFPD